MFEHRSKAKEATPSRSKDKKTSKGDTIPHSEKAPRAHYGLKSHASSDCKLKDASCHACGKQGHINQCKSSSTKFAVDNFLSNTSEDCTDIGVCNVTHKKSDPYFVKLIVNGDCVSFELDTGSDRTMISESFYYNIQVHVKCER